MKSFQGLKDITGRKTIFFLIALAVIILDRITKYLSLNYLTQEIKIIPSVFSLKFTVNTGAGFGLFQGKTLMLSIISALFIIFILYYLKQIIMEKYCFAVALIFGGAIANLFDRVFYGFVIDFMYIQFFPIFNVADTAISIGAVALFVYLMKDYFPKKKTHHINHSKK